jgi:phage head maturation protease
MSERTTKTITGLVTRAEAPGRRIVFRASSSDEDLMGDTIDQHGIDLSGYKANPVLLADHDHHFILGLVRRLWVAPTATGESLMAEAEVLVAGTSQRIDERWAAIEAGAARGISIGFIGVEMEARAASGGRVGVHFRKTRLLEISSVSIPACPTCLVMERSACACGGGGDDDAIDLQLEDEQIDVSAEEVRAACRVIVPQLAQAAVARAQRIDLEAISRAFDPLQNVTDAAALAQAIRVVVPSLVRREMERLRGRIVDPD